MFPSKITTATAMTMLAAAGAAVILAGVAATGGRADETPKPAVGGLSAKIVVTSKPLVRIEDVQAELLLTNESDKPLRICTLCGGLRSAWEGNYQETFCPDFFKSDRPTAEQSAGRVVTLQPGKSASLPISPINTYGGNPREVDGKLKVVAAYEVGDEFAKKFDTWAGRVEAEPVVIAVKAADAEEAGSWSPPINGLQARLSVARKEPFNGTPMLAVYLELRNVSDRAAVMEVPLDTDKVRFTVTDSADKPIPPTSGPYDELTAPLGLLRLPHDGQLRFNVSHHGAGVPKDQAAMLDLGVTSQWEFKRADEQTYYLQARLTVQDGNDQRWSGTLELPKVRLPVAHEDH